MNITLIPILLTFILLFISALVGAIAASKLKLPLMVGYIAGGVVVGNLFASLLSHETITLVADIGVTLLMFTLGIDFSMQRLKKHIGTVVGAAIIQIVLLAFLFCALFMVLGFSFFASLVIAIAASLSSTAVVIRILSEKGELDTSHGELLTAWLVVQDLSVIPLMLILPVMLKIGVSDGTFFDAMRLILPQIGKGIGAIAAIVILGRFVLPRLFSVLANLGSREVLVLATAGLVLLVGLTFMMLGLSSALGAFIAGMMLAETSEKHEIFSDIRPFRDLCAGIFFVSIGLALPLGSMGPLWVTILLSTLVIVLLKWGIVYTLCRFIGLHKKTAVIVGIGLVPMSEFGFILAREGMQIGALSQNNYLFLVAVTFCTICIGAPTLSRAHRLYGWFKHTIGRILPPVFKTRTEKDQEKGIVQMDISGHVVICGYGRVGKYVGRALEMAGVPFVVIDYDHQRILALKKKGIHAVFGDPSDIDVLDYAQVDLAKCLVIAIPDRYSQESIIANALTLNRTIPIICRTHHESDLRELKTLGVTTLVQPEFEAALTIVGRLLHEFGNDEEQIRGKVSRLKIEHGLG